MNFLTRVLFLASITLLALGASPSTGTPTTATITSSVFVNSVGPNLVWDATGKDSDWYAEIPYLLTLFGPGTDNTTIYAYGGSYTGGSNYPYTGGTIIQRAINASIVSNMTSSSESSVIGDKQATFTDTIQSSPATCVGYGSVAWLYPSSDGTNTQLHLMISSGTTATTVAITSDAPPSNTVYKYEEYLCWYDPVGIYYVAWSTISAVTSGGSTTYSTLSTNVQAVNATNIKTMWSPAVSVAPNGSPCMCQTMKNLVAGGSNSSNSSIIYLSYLLLSTSGDFDTATISLTLINATSGIIITTKSALTTNTNSVRYNPAGIIGSDYMNGLVLALDNTTGTYYVLYNISNGTFGAAAIVTDTPSSYTALTYEEGGSYGATGWASGSGYGIAFMFQTSGSLSYVYETYYQNGTVNMTYTIGTVSIPESGFTSNFPANFFVDPNGALWFGYSLFDTEKASDWLSIQGYVGKLIAQTHSSLSAEKSFVALFSLLFVAMISIAL